MKHDKVVDAGPDAKSARSWPVLLAVLAILMSTACSGTDALPDASPLAAAPVPRTVAYTVKISPAAASVSVRVTRPGADPFLFETSEDIADSESFYPVARAKAADGTKLEVRREGNTWSISGAGERDFTLTYVFAVRDDLGSPEDLSPFHSTSAFLGWGDAVFVLPAADAGVERVQVAVKTEGGWGMPRTSWGRSELETKDPRSLQGSLILAGEWGFTSFEANDLLVQAATPPTWPGAVADIAEQFRSYLAFHETVFGRHNDNAALIVVAKHDAGDATASSHASRGTSMVVLVPEKQAPAGAGEALLEAHISGWVHDNLPARQFADDARWIRDLLEPYYVLRGRIATKALAEENLPEELNGMIAASYNQRSPRSRQATALLGLLTDVKLRADSKGVRSLDDVVRHLAYVLAEDRKLVLDGAGLVELLTKFTGRSWQEFVEDHVHRKDGHVDLVRLDRAGIIISPEKGVGYSLGFTTEGAIAPGATVDAVTEGGPAAEAGLDKGDVLESVEIPTSTAEKVRLEVVRQGRDKPKKVRYTPAIETDVPRVVDITGLFADWFLP